VGGKQNILQDLNNTLKAYIYNMAKDFEGTCNIIYYEGHENSRRNVINRKTLVAVDTKYKF